MTKKEIQIILEKELLATKILIENYNIMTDTCIKREEQRQENQTFNRRTQLEYEMQIIKNTYYKNGLEFALNLFLKDTKSAKK